MNKEAFKAKEHFSYEDLFALLRLLRSPEGCPWDRAQTHASVRRGMIEEAYEVAEAIDRKDPAMMTEELGDLMMQVIFHICIAEDEGAFNAQDVYDRVCKKLIFRHPHIFADAPDASASTEEGWQAIKRKEKGQKTQGEELRGIARTLPELTRAEKIAGKLYKGDNAAELQTLLQQQAAKIDSAPDLAELLFTASRLAKLLKIDPEEALHYKNEEIIRHFD